MKFKSPKFNFNFLIKYVPCVFKITHFKPVFLIIASESKKIQMYSFDFEIILLSFHERDNKLSAPLQHHSNPFLWIDIFDSVITRSPSSWLMWFIFPSSWTINVHLRGQIVPPCPLGGVFGGHNHVRCTYLKVYTYYQFHEKISKKMIFNLSKKILSILALFVESPKCINTVTVNSKVKITNISHGTNMGSGLFSVSKKLRRGVLGK